MTSAGLERPMRSLAEAIDDADLSGEILARAALRRYRRLIRGAAVAALADHPALLASR